MTTTGGRTQIWLERMQQIIASFKVNLIDLI